MSIAGTTIRLPLVAVLLAGVAMVAMGGWTYVQAKASADWPSVQGTVVSTGVKRSWLSGTTSGSRSRRRRRRYKVTITYDYEVDGQTYRSDRQSFTGLGSSATTRHGAERLAEEYPEGAAVTVYYAPDNPAKAVLEAGPSWGNVALPICGLVVIVVAGVQLVMRRSGAGEGTGRSYGAFS